MIPMKIGSQICLSRRVTCSGGIAQKDGASRGYDFYAKCNSSLQPRSARKPCTEPVRLLHHNDTPNFSRFPRAQLDEVYAATDQLSALVPAIPVDGAVRFVIGTG